MKAILLVILALSATSNDANRSSDGAPGPVVGDPWSQVRFLEGEWTGVAQGEPGVGTVHRSYQFVLGYRYLHERNVSAYAPPQLGKPGEVHEHWSFISWDKKRKSLVLRQFHQEGFVNQYVLAAEQGTARRLVFVSEAFENLDGRWRAREIYDLISADEFTETFELAEPGGEFRVYSRNSFQRAKYP
ncbi:MAG: hypothetical protein U0X73_15590 [Thermoanaerobaculia bacterium]